MPSWAVPISARWPQENWAHPNFAARTEFRLCARPWHLETTFLLIPAQSPAATCITMTAKPMAVSNKFQPKLPLLLIAHALDPYSAKRVVPCAGIR